MDIPLWMLPHTVVVESLTGQGAYGEVYGEPVETPCFRSEQRKLVRNERGDEVVSETSLITNKDWAELFPVGSRIAIPETGHHTEVISAHIHTDGGRGVWEHCEVVLA